MLSVSRNRRSNWKIRVYFRRVIPRLVNSVMKASIEVQDLLSFLHLPCVDIPCSYKMAEAAPGIMCRHDRALERKKHFLPYIFFFFKWGKPFPEISLVHHTLGPINPWARKNPWSRKWQSTPVFFLGKFHGQRSPADYIVHRVSKNWTRLCDWACSWTLNLQWRWKGYFCSTEYHFKSIYWVMLEISERKTCKYFCLHGA